MFRQKNANFVHALNELRAGRLSAKSVAMLSQGGGKPAAASTQAGAGMGMGMGVGMGMQVGGEASERCAEPVRLFAHNNGADNLNRQRLDALTTEQLRWEAVDAGDKIFVQQLQKNSAAPATFD